jgi:mono/diheme cytochrome c family protein
MSTAAGTRRVNAIAIAAITFTLAAGAGAAAVTSRTTFSGVYTAAQAAKGEEIFSESCAPCHRQAPGGVTSPLSGPAFAARWQGQTVADLFEKIRISMPENAPGTLSAQANVDVVAYLLQVNGFPAGSIELVPTLTVLREIQVEAPPPTKDSR